MFQRPRKRAPATSPFLLAKILANLVRPEEALRELERGVVERSSWSLDLNVDPELESRRLRTGFSELVRRRGRVGAGGKPAFASRGA